MPKHLALATAIPALALMMALMTAGCASTGGGGTYDETLMDCRSKADGVVKARYTPKWQAVVDQCMEEAGDK